MATFEEEKEEFLSHYGVPGMKWGKRKGGGGGIDTGKPTQLKALGLGLYGNKNRFTDPKALQLRQKAGKQRVATILTSVASTAVSTIGMNSSNPSVRAGAAIAGNVMGLAASGMGISSLVNASRAIKTQDNS